MPYDLDILLRLKKQGWRVKIYDGERLEPPHVTILFKGQSWRLSLRDRAFLDRGDRWSQIDERVRTAVEAAWEDLQKAWDRMYPKNPVSSQDHE